MTMASWRWAASSKARAVIRRGSVRVLTRNPNRKIQAAARGARYTERYSHNSRRIDQYSTWVAGIILEPTSGEAIWDWGITVESVLMQWLLYFVMTATNKSAMLGVRTSPSVASCWRSAWSN